MQRIQRGAPAPDHKVATVLGEINFDPEALRTRYRSLKSRADSEAKGEIERYQAECITRFTSPMLRRYVASGGPADVSRAYAVRARLGRGYRQPNIGSDRRALLLTLLATFPASANG